MPAEGDLLANNIPVTIKLSVVPVKSLTNSAQLIADYMAGKIEESYPIQSLFQEIITLFQQEAICIGPAFRNNAENESERSGTKKNMNPKSVSTRGSKGPKGTATKGMGEVHKPTGAANFQKNNLSDSGDKPVVEGFRISCSGRLQMSPRSKPAEKAESVVISRGVLPFNSLDQNIDFKQTYATNAYGTIGIKVWVHYISRPSTP